MNTTDPSAWAERLARAGITPAPAADPGPGTAAPAAPWAVRLLAGVGGFIGGVMILLLFAVGMASLKFFDTPEAATFLGLVLAVGAVLVYRLGAGGVAIEQCALAISIAAQITLAIGIGPLFKSGGHLTWWPLVAVQATMLVLVRNRLHRTLVCAAMVILGALSLRQVAAVAVWSAAAALAATAWAIAAPRLAPRGAADGAAAPVFGALAGLLIVQWPWTFVAWKANAGAAHLAWHWAAALPALVLAAGWLAAHAGVTARIAVFALALAAGLLGLWLPAWTTALCLAVLGIGTARPGWAIVAALAMIVSVGFFYYSLRVTLIEKAVWMAGAGAACLVLAALVRGVGGRLVRQEEGS
ncbi:MAG: DUF4401 domain-containing protein [Burkholderiales bacterium]|nr:DUF4401 domain-containing protein [Burkholderiales bacterium]